MSVNLCSEEKSPELNFSDCGSKITQRHSINQIIGEDDEMMDRTFEVEINNMHYQQAIHENKSNINIPKTVDITLDSIIIPEDQLIHQNEQ